MRAERTSNLETGAKGTAEIAQQVEPVASPAASAPNNPLAGASVVPLGLAPRRPEPADSLRRFVQEGDQNPLVLSRNNASLGASGRTRAAAAARNGSIGNEASQVREKASLGKGPATDAAGGSAHGGGRGEGPPVLKGEPAGEDPERDRQLGKQYAVSAPTTDAQAGNAQSEEESLTIAEFLQRLPNKRSEFRRAVEVRDALGYAAESEILDQSNVFGVIRELSDTDEVHVQTQIEVDQETKRVVQKNRIYAKTTDELREIMRETYRFAGGEIDEEGIDEHILHAEQRAEASRKIGATDIVHMIQYGVDPESGDLSMQPFTLTDVTTSKLAVAAAIAHPEVLTDIDINDLQSMGYAGPEAVYERIVSFNETNENKLPMPLSLHEIREDPTENESILDSERKTRSWVRTFAKVGKTIDNNIRFIRLAEHATGAEIAQKADINWAYYKQYEAGMAEPDLTNANKIIEASSLAPDGKAAQFLRAQSEKEKLMTADKLQECKAGELIKYLRILNGATGKDLALILDYSPQSITDIESGRFIIAEPKLEKFITWLNLPKDSSLEVIIRQKIEEPDEQIPEDILQKALNEKFLFQEYIDQMKAAQLSENDEQRLRSLTAGEIIRTLRKEKHISVTSLSELSGVGFSTITAIESGRAIPHDVNIVRLLEHIGYDIHDPITQYALDVAREKRAERRQHTGTILIQKQPVAEGTDLIGWAKGLLDEGIPADFFAFSEKDELLTRRLLQELQLKRFEDLPGIIEAREREVSFGELREKIGGGGVLDARPEEKDSSDQIRQVISDIIEIKSSEGSVPWETIPHSVISELSLVISREIRKPRTLISIDDLKTTKFRFLKGNSLSDYVKYLESFTEATGKDTQTLFRETAGIRMPTEEEIERLIADIDPIAFQDWMTEAACKEADPNDLYPDSAKEVQRSIHIYCKNCGVRELCLGDALERRMGTGEIYQAGDFGIWGGMSMKKRGEFVTWAGKNVPGGVKGAIVLLRDFNAKEKERRLAK